jgi:serine/threonine-protein kinase
MLGRLGKYDIEGVVGRGGMGVVLAARDPVLDRCVAIKVLAGHLAASAAARKRFAYEARSAAAVVHDHIIPIHDVDTSGQTPFLVMPFVSGRSLQDRLDERGSLETREVLRIAMQTAEGLAAAHAQGLVHRDIKPANILLENGCERVRITDFGLARAVDDASQTQSGFIAGTPQYMAPEQARGEPIDARADLFSLGSVMYAMCTGRPPFRAETTLAVLRRICDDAPRSVREVNPDVPPWLAEIIERLLAKSPAARFQTAGEVADLLKQWLAHLAQPTVILPPKFVAASGQKEKIRGKWLPWTAVAGTAAVALTVGLAVWLSGALDVGPAGPAGPESTVTPSAPVELPPGAQNLLADFAGELSRAQQEMALLEASLPVATDAGTPIADEVAAISLQVHLLEQELDAFTGRRTGFPARPEPIPELGTDR